jgi:hypothetical protein
MSIYDPGLLFWSSSLTTLIGFDLKGYGALLFIVVGLILTYTIIFMNKIKGKIGFLRPVHSTLWSCAAIGPYVNLYINNSWNIPGISHMVGLFTSILTFIISYLLDTTLERNSIQTG